MISPYAGHRSMEGAVPEPRSLYKKINVNFGTWKPEFILQKFLLGSEYRTQPAPFSMSNVPDTP